MQITYLHHSGFLVETSDCYLLFDYIKGRLPTFCPQKPLYIFVSHQHGDHYADCVLTVGEEGQTVVYLLSDDIDNAISTDHTVIWCHPHQRYTIDGITVETLQSTDLGVAFWVTTTDGVIYHAGDLNDWHWTGEDPAWNTQMHRDYLAQMTLLQGRQCKVAFLPLDTRLVDHCTDGVDGFLAAVKTDLLVGMHYFGDPTAAIAQCCDRYPTQAHFLPTEEGEQITI